MKKIFLKIVIGVVLACILFVCFLYTNNEIGVTSSKLEADIRSSQKIKDDWTVDGSVSSTMAAYISYPQDLSDHSFSVYVNRPGLSFGYFFRGGGTLSGIQRGIVEFTVEGYNERAFISMNQQQVQQLEIDDGNTIQVVDIDRNKPFAIVLPINAGNITFYDVTINVDGLYDFYTESDKNVDGSIKALKNVTGIGKNSKVFSIFDKYGTKTVKTIEDVVGLIGG